MTTISTALTIAGTDPSGGAGIQADLKTFQELKSYGMSVITSVVAQNTTGVQAVHHIPLSMIEQQLDAVLSDIDVHAFKTGMVANVDMMNMIKKKMEHVDAHYVMDPVMVATSGDALIDKEAHHFLRSELLPLTTIVTPNIPEAETIIGQKITTLDEMIDAAKTIVTTFGARSVLVTGGHLVGDTVDVLYDGQEIYTLSAKRIDTNNSHGTGCTLSAAIVAYLSQNVPLVEAVHRAKAYITKAIQHSFDIGQGSGPTNHWAPRIMENTNES